MNDREKSENEVCQDHYACRELHSDCSVCQNEGPGIPVIVCLCGSTRFYAQFQESNYRETMAGKIVLSVGFYPHSQQQAHGGDVGVDPAKKIELDRLHFRKIDLADEILVLNVGGYIGESTRNEINYAESVEKVIRYLEEPISGGAV